MRANRKRSHRMLDGVSVHFHPFRHLPDPPYIWRLGWRV